MIDQNKSCVPLGWDKIWPSHSARRWVLSREPVTEVGTMPIVELVLVLCPWLSSAIRGCLSQDDGRPAAVVRNHWLSWVPK